MADQFYVINDLLDPPVQRAAYSDRMAWKMAVMSQLAYLPFEGEPAAAQVRKVAEGIAASHGDAEQIVRQLNTLLDRSRRGGGARTVLETGLEQLRFELLDTFSVSVPFCVDSQAFIARVGPAWRKDGRNDFLVLAFRGTEPRKFADLRTDLRASLIDAPGDKKLGAKVHEGFYKALMQEGGDGRSIRDRIDEVLHTPEHKGLPVFITGHSLGGALAVVAARYIANGSRGAAYTFGQPLVGNEPFNDQIFTPVYRMVNAADIVPAVPFAAVFMKLVIALFNFIPVVKRLVPLLKKIEGYRHGGDQRFYFPAKPVHEPDAPVRYPGMRVVSNPGLLDRWGSSLGRFIASWGGVLLEDHAIAGYVQKAGAHALTRLETRRALNPGPHAEAEIAAAKAAVEAAAATVVTPASGAGASAASAAAQAVMRQMGKSPSSRAKAPAKSGAKPAAKAAAKAPAKTPAAKKPASTRRRAAKKPPASEGET